MDTWLAFYKIKFMKRFLVKKKTAEYVKFEWSMSLIYLKPDWNEGVTNVDKDFMNSLKSVLRKWHFQNEFMRSSFLQK